MRKNLLGAVIFLIVFWWIILSLYWLVGYLNSLHLLERFLDPYDAASLFDILVPIKIMFTYWTVPVLLLVLFTMVVGAMIAYASVVIPALLKNKKIESNKIWKGVSFSLGDIPTPEWDMGVEVEDQTVVNELINDVNREAKKQFKLTGKKINRIISLKKGIRHCSLKYFTSFG